MTTSRATDEDHSDAPPKNLEKQGDKPARVLAADWMRGLVMLIMTLDPASNALSAVRLTTDGSTLYDPSVGSGNSAASIPETLLPRSCS